ncbi:hypothetical protein D3C81_1861830 [compost metagenome]
MPLDRRHEALGPEEVRIHVPLGRQPLPQLLLIQQADRIPRRAHAIVFGIAIEALELRMARGQAIDPVAKRMHRAIACTVDEMHQAPGRQGRFKHRQGWRDTHSTTDQHQGLVAGSQGELTRGWEQLQAVAHVQLIM